MNTYHIYFDGQCLFKNLTESEFNIIYGKIYSSTYYIIQKEMKNITFMKKYTDSKVPITIDPISNEYKITIPEWVVNEFDWYEDTELVWVVDDQGIHIQEVSE